MKKVVLQNETVEFLQGHEIGDRENLTPFPDKAVALGFLHHIAAHLRDISILRSLLINERNGVDVCQLDDHQMLETLANRLFYGGIKVKRTPRSVIPPAVGTVQEKQQYMNPLEWEKEKRRGEGRSTKAKEPPQNEKKQQESQMQKKLKAARKAQRKATEIADQQRRSQKGTVASDGGRTISGWMEGEKQRGFDQVDSQKMLKYCEKINHNLPPAGGMDHGVLGQYQANHAEKRLAFLHKEKKVNSPIGVSEEMCGDCRKFFRNHANHIGEPVVVADPKYTRVFNPDKSVDIYDNSGNKIRTVRADEPPKASATNYKGIEW